MSIWDYAWGHQLVLYFSDGLSYIQSPAEHARAAQRNSTQSRLKLQTGIQTTLHCADRDVGNGAKLPSIACFCWYFIFDFIVPSSLSICLGVKLCSLSEEISAITSNVLHRKILLRRSKYYVFTISLLTLSSQTNNCNFNILTL